MSPDSLPLALLILFAEMAVGGLWILLFAQARNNAASSFVKFEAVMVLIVAAFAFVISSLVDVGSDVDGYPLDNGWMSEARYALAGLFVLSALYTYATVRDHRRAALTLGGLGSLVGIAALVFIAAVVSVPTWGYALTLASLVIGALVVGAVSNGMVLGHWYLVTPRLDEAPLREMTGLLVLFMVAQGVLIAVSLALPRDTVNTSVDTPVLENMFLWLRVSLGLAFPAALAWMAYDSSGVRAMQSATGLLYIAMVLVICGEVVAKGLMFVSAVPN